MRRYRFYYRLTFSPYENSVMAKNTEDAWKCIERIWPEYNVREIVTLLGRR